MFSIADLQRGSRGVQTGIPSKARCIAAAVLAAAMCAFWCEELLYADDTAAQASATLIPAKPNGGSGKALPQPQVKAAALKEESLTVARQVAEAYPQDAPRLA